MHPVYRKRCERDGRGLESMWLGVDDIEPDSGGPAVIEQPTKIVTRPFNVKDEDDRVRIALASRRSRRKKTFAVRKKGSREMAATRWTRRRAEAGP
jgi:hypothetical protein